MSDLTIEEALRKNTDELMLLPGVIGVGIGKKDENPCIMIFVREKSPALQGRLPTEINGFPTVIEESGEFRALDSD